MSEYYGKIKSIEEIDLNTTPSFELNGKNGSRPSMSEMLNALSGYSSMSGYKVTTDQKEIYVLIGNGQCCCEEWGYFVSEDETDCFIGAQLREINLTDIARNTKKVEETYGNYNYGGGIQFVDFVTDKGVFQLAVYNQHNGYYGHSILVAVNDKIIHRDVL